MDKGIKRVSAISRRDFMKNTAVAGGALITEGSLAETAPAEPIRFVPAEATKLAALTQGDAKLSDLRPARWIWYPSGRTLANTMVLFRRTINVPAPLRRATGWINGSSRYTLFANGQRIQFGPAPSDPRYEEMDPVDLTEVLQSGRNTIGVQVLYYGHGDGTWAIGKPGLLFWIELEMENGQKQVITSDSLWQAHYARAWRTGQFKRYFLRAFQEDFDARLYPHGWQTVDFTPDQTWVPAMVLNGSADMPPLAIDYQDYSLDVGASASCVKLIPRTIPLMRENWLPVKQLSESLWVQWQRPAEDYFELAVPDAFTVDRAVSAKETSPGTWEVELDGTRAAVLWFEFTEQIVGWPAFTIEAPAGTIVELLTQEAHDPGGPALRMHYYGWSRFTCQEGVNRFEAFDFESLRWIELHIRNARGRINIHDVGIRRRQYPWPNEPQIQVSEPALQKLLNASVNTLHNCAQETLVDGMGRERQQYSGDCGHQQHAIYFTFGEWRLPARFMRTYSQSMTLDGYFLSSWPGYDLLARLMQRQLGLTRWGPLLDHGVAFNFDCFHYYQHTGDLKPLAEVYPRLLRFAEYLKSICGPDGLLPVDDIGIPAVWMDFDGYLRPRHRQCAFNLYTAAMLEHAMTVLCRAFRDEANAMAAQRFGSELRRAAIARFWSPEHRLFIDNLPWLTEEKEMRTHDRSLATAILYEQCPDGQYSEGLKALASLPPHMGLSYPNNAGWRCWALAKGGRVDVVLNELRNRWSQLPSVLLNNTLQEMWNSSPDSNDVWSHSPVVPLYVFFMSVAGITPLAPGFRRVEIRPQLADLDFLELTAHTVQGPIKFRSQGLKGNRELTITLPADCAGELVLPAEESVSLTPLPESVSGLARYQMPAGGSLKFTLAN